LKSDQEIVEMALRTIDIEAESVKTLKTFINGDFIESVKLIHFSEGRVIITGIGKSAIIAQKIVATLNSTGTPAVFHACCRCHSWRFGHHSTT
jgi:arabinose-5-phosphate isomerase